MGVIFNKNRTADLHVMFAYFTLNTISLVILGRKNGFCDTL